MGSGTTATGQADRAIMSEKFPNGVCYDIDPEEVSVPPGRTEAPSHPPG